MNIWSDYIAYVKDNPKGYWFKRRPYGYGWTPVKWQGWLTILVFLALIIGNAYRMDIVQTKAGDILLPFVLQTIFLTAMLIAICYKKGESPKWQWNGLKKKQ